MRGRVWKDALAKIGDIEKVLPTSKLRSKSKVHRKILILLKKYRRRKLLNRADLNLIDDLYKDIVSSGTRTSTRKRKTEVYKDVDELLNTLKNIAKSSKRSADSDDAKSTSNEKTAESRAEDKKTNDVKEANSSEDDNLVGIGYNEYLDEDMVINPETGEITHFSYADENDLILDSMGYTDKDGNISKNLFFYKSDEHARSLNEEDVVIKTLAALRAHLGEKNFYDFLNATSPSGKALYEEINSRYAEFNIDSDQPQGYFYELINYILDTLKKTAENTGLFDSAKDVFKQANTFLQHRYMVMHSVDTLGIYVPKGEDYDEIFFNSSINEDEWDNIFDV